jgi:tRNA(Ile2) C34 agmatinyltransferase TiaS
VELLEGWETTRVIADTGYDTQSVLDHMATMGAEAVIPQRSKRSFTARTAREVLSGEEEKNGIWQNVFSTRSSSSGGGPARQVLV